MGLFKGLKKVFNPGGAILSKVINDGRDYQGVLDYAMHGQDQAKKNQAAQQAAQTQFVPKPAYSPAPGGISRYPAMQLGWTNGGYNYAHGGVGAPMSFGGGLPPPNLGGASGIGNMGTGATLQPAPSGTTMPPAGAPQQPTGQQMMIGRLRGSIM